MSVRARRSLATDRRTRTAGERLRGPDPRRVTPTPRAGAAVSTNTDHDYATVNFSDPWDFSNTADFPLDEAQNFSTYDIANGVLDAKINAGGGLIMAQAIAGSIPDRRSTSLLPDRRRHLPQGLVPDEAIRPIDDVGRLLLVLVRPHHPGLRERVRRSRCTPGRNTYSFDIPSQGTLPEPGSKPPWAGVIKGIRLVPSGSEGHPHPARLAAPHAVVRFDDTTVAPGPAARRRQPVRGRRGRLRHRRAPRRRGT